MRWTGERAIPWTPEQGPHILQAHVERYAWALRWVWGKKVVDLGCGSGYGTFMLSWGAKKAIGIDVSTEAVHWAARHFPAPNIEWGVLDITKRGYTADVYVAFEVLEHLEDPHVITQKYRPLVWSMPIDDGSKYHVRPYSQGQILEMMGYCRIWYQYADGMIQDPLFEHRPDTPTYLLGVLE